MNTLDYVAKGITITDRIKDSDRDVILDDPGGPDVTRGRRVYFYISYLLSYAKTSVEGSEQHTSRIPAFRVGMGLLEG